MFDVAIVGGGPAASVTAMLLARAGKSCVILERGDDTGDKPGESLPPSARPLLERLELWDALAADGHRRCHGNRSRWGSDVIEEMPFVFSPYGHGWHLDRRRFERLLISRAVGVERRTGTRVVEATRDGHWKLRCDDGSVVAALFVVDATGRASWFARRAGAKRVLDNALVAYVSFEAGEERDSFTFVEAHENGWSYTAPIPDGRRVKMFVTDPGNTMVEGRRVDASSMCLDRVTGDGWLAVGDAAAAPDPLSSHGLGNAMAQAIEAAAAIVSGSFARYERMVDTMWESYVRVRHATYALEQRWPHSRFWLTNQHHVQRVDDARDHGLLPVLAPGVINDHPFAEPGQLLRGVRS